MSEVVGDRYRLDAELGAGGTATVWLAQDLVLDRVVAVKLLIGVQGRAALARRERMRTEARALARLDHPNVVRIFDLGTHDDDRDYLVMEYVEGGSLAQRLGERGPLAPMQAVDVALEVLDALTAAHAEGIVHRDVKPGNVLCRTNGHVALCDFGIARQTGGGTETGVLLGSVGYMAPEQRVDARKVGPSADVYGVGCTLFHAVTCETPVDLYLAADHSPRFHAVPRPLLPVVRRATRADPGDRYHTAEEMAQALRAVRTAVSGLPAAVQRPQTPVGAHPRTSVPATAPLSVRAGERQRQVQAEDYAWSERPPRAGRTALWIGVAAVALVALAGVFAPWFLDQRLEGDAPEEPPVIMVERSPQGIWVGTFDGNRAMLELKGEPEALTGELLLILGSHERPSTVEGTWDAPRRRLLLRDVAGAPGAGSYDATLDADGLVLRGEFLPSAGGPAIRFALVPLD